ncbi:unnamed protein product, partial [Staurois parvus]
RALGPRYTDHYFNHYSVLIDKESFPFLCTTKSGGGSEGLVVINPTQ